MGTIGRRDFLKSAALAGAAVVARPLIPRLARAEATTPRGVHVSFGADPRAQLTAAWHTSNAQEAIIQYGPSATDLSLSATGTSQLPWGPVPDTILHEAAIGGLASASDVFYRVGDGTTWSPVRRARTAPPTDVASFRFTFFSDHGRSERAQRTTGAAIAAQPDFHLIAGDLSYADTEPWEWNTWFDLVEPFFSTVPLMASPGNHEMEQGLGGDRGVSFRMRVALPGDELFYSFDYGRVHFLVLDSTPVPAIEEGWFGPQLQFAYTDLESAARRKRAGEIDFLIVVQHHPLYANQEASAVAAVQGRQKNVALIAWEEHAFQVFGVDLLLVGHNHYYERTRPMAYNTATTQERTNYTDPAGFIEVISGGGGAGLYLFRDPNDYEPWMAANARRHHFTMFDVAGKTLRARAISTDDPTGELLDEFTLTTT